MQSSAVEYGSMEPLIQPKKATRSKTRWIIAFMVIFAGAISYYYFYYVPNAVSNIPITNSNVVNHALIVSNTKEEEITEKQIVTIEYTYEELMDYADDMSPDSPNWKQFHDELIAESGVNPNEVFIQFAVSDPVEQRIVANWGGMPCTACTYGCCTFSASCPYNWGKGNKCDFRTVLKPTKAPKTKKPKPTKAPKTKKPKPTKALKTKKPKPTKAPKTPKPKPTRSPTTAMPTAASGLICKTVIGSFASGPSQLGTVKQAVCNYDEDWIRVGCSSLFTGDYSDYSAYSGGYGVSGEWTFSNYNAKESCVAGARGHYIYSNHPFQVQSRCCTDALGEKGAGLLGDKYGQIGTNSWNKESVKVTSSSQYCATKKNTEKIGTWGQGYHEMFTGCVAFADFSQDGGSTAWGGPLDPGFGGVRRTDDGSCQAQTWSSQTQTPCTDKNTENPCSEVVIYLDHDDILYFNSISDDNNAEKEYQKTLIENAGYNAENNKNVNFVWKVISNEKKDQYFKVNCGWGPPPVRYSEGWAVNSIEITKVIGNYEWECINEDAKTSTYDSVKKVHESVAGCPTGMTLTDCNGYIADQIDDCDGPKGKLQNLWGTRFDGDLCRALGSSSNIRAQAVCCTLS